MDCSEFVEKDGSQKWWVEHFLRLEKQILQGLEYSGGTHNLEDVAMALHKDQMQLWPGLESVLLTELVQYPRMKVFHVFLGAGKMTELIQMIPYVVEQAKLEGCRKVTVTGRRGWERVLARYVDSKPTHYWLSLEI